MQLSLEATWPQAVKLAASWVQDAWEQSLQVYNTPEGPIRRVEAAKATSMIGHARGALAVLRVMRPGDPELEELWKRLIHCPVIMLAGDEQSGHGRLVRRA